MKCSVKVPSLLLLSCFFFTVQSQQAEVSIGTPFSKTATKVLLCGSGELGKEFTIELQRLGVQVIAVDRYEHAPAMHVATDSYVFSMLDGKALKSVVEIERPDFIVPEIEAIDTAALIELEERGYTVIPTAYATHITMNRERIRRLAAEELNLKTSRYFFADTYENYVVAVAQMGFPCVVKPIMSSSGKGQSVIYKADEVQEAWHYAQEGSRSGTKGTVIIEEFIDFDYEVTLLTIRSAGGTQFCQPIGHTHVHGEYYESWQPHPMNEQILAESQRIAKTITDALGGRGVFGVELFVKGNDVYFSEVSPRPHDTGMVTLVSQDLSEFALHARAILGLPIPAITQYGPAASRVLLVDGNSKKVRFANLQQALTSAGTSLRLFGKPEVKGHRRMGVALATGKTIEEARQKTGDIIESITVEL